MIKKVGQSLSLKFAHFMLKAALSIKAIYQSGPDFDQSDANFNRSVRIKIETPGIG
jgi:hypothetical protein